MNNGDYCTTYAPRHPLAVPVLPVCLAVLLYAVWLATVAVAVVASPARQLHAAQTCVPVSG